MGRETAASEQWGKRLGMVQRWKMEETDSTAATRSGLGKRMHLSQVYPSPTSDMICLCVFLLA